MLRKSCAHVATRNLPRDRRAHDRPHDDETTCTNGGDWGPASTRAGGATCRMKIEIGSRDSEPPPMRRDDKREAGVEPHDPVVVDVASSPPSFWRRGSRHDARARAADGQGEYQYDGVRAERDASTDPCPVRGNALFVLLLARSLEAVLLPSLYRSGLSKK